MHPSSRADFDQLQGVWSPTYLEADGIADPPDDEHTAPGAVCIFEGDRFRVVAPGDVLLLEGTFELGATASPKAITWIDSIGEDAGKALPAIYELTETTFRFVAADEGGPRPMRFETVAGLTLREFIRVG